MDIKKIIHRVRAIREGGYTQRVHTTPHHGRYSVAEHSWGVATLLAILHPHPSKELILAALWHDVPERWTGDIPAPAKWYLGDVLRSKLSEFENSIETHLDIKFNLSILDTEWLKACDMLDFLLWSIDQGALGNGNAYEGRSNAEHWFNARGDEVPKIIREFISHYRWERTSDMYGWKL